MGEKFRQIRDQNELPLRKLAALLNIDVSILSKIERGGSKLSKEVVLKPLDMYK